MKGGEELRATVDELAKFGVVDYVALQGQKHIKVRFHWNGEPKMIVVSSTGSDRLAPLNCRKTVRQVLGVKRAVTKSKRPKRQRNNTIVAQLPETFTRGRDPWEDYRIEGECIVAMKDYTLGVRLASTCRRIAQRAQEAVARISA